jgi:hypothetical protein
MVILDFADASYIAGVEINVAVGWDKPEFYGG